MLIIVFLEVFNCWPNLSCQYQMQSLDNCHIIQQSFKQSNWKSNIIKSLISIPLNSTSRTFLFLSHLLLQLISSSFLLPSLLSVCLACHSIQDFESTFCERGDINKALLMVEVWLKIYEIMFCKANSLFKVDIIP